MAITPQQRERLDRLMNERRLELGITWRDVASRAGLSYESLRGLRAGPGGIRELTGAKISRALGWTPRSVADILAGGEPQADVQPERPPAGDDASVVILEEALTAFEASIMSSDMPEWLKPLVIDMYRRIDGEELLRRIAEEIPRSSSG